MDTKEKFKKFIKNYYPTLLLGTATIASIATGTIIGRKTEMSLSAAAALATGAYNKYQNKVKEVLGMDAHKTVMDGVAKDAYNDALKECKIIEVEKDDRRLWFHPYTGYFKAREIDILNAWSNMNMRINSTNDNGMFRDSEKGWCTLGQFLREAKAELLDSARKFEDLDYWGWNRDYLDEVACDCWIYLSYGETNVYDGCEYVELIFRTAEPIADPSVWNAYRRDEILYPEDLNPTEQYECLEDLSDHIRNDDKIADMLEEAASGRISPEEDQ